MMVGGGGGVSANNTQPADLLTAALNPGTIDPSPVCVAC
jgi:hypothetical protein